MLSVILERARRPLRLPSAAGLARAELLMGGLLTLVLVGLHCAFLLHAGGMWRDEVQIVNLANTPSLQQWWEYNEHDTFPVVWQLMVRLWTAAGWGDTDLGLRVLGLLVGLGILVALWRGARRLYGGAPLISLTLFAFTPAVIRYGDSLRGYGMGTLAMLLMVPAVWALSQQPTRGRALVALGLALLGVQSMHFNAVILFAVGLGAVAVSWQQRRPAIAAQVIGVGLVAAVSILPYLDPIRRQARWRSIVLYPTSLRWLFGRFTQVVTDYGDGMFWVWMLLLVAAPVVCVYRLRRPAPDDGAQGRARALFMGLALVLGSGGYALFLLGSQLATQRWYYVGILGFLALGLDVVIDLLVRASPAARIARLGCVGVVAALLVPTVFAQVQVRMTNLDLIAAELTRQGRKDDLIVVNPWWYGVTFARSYRGAAAWTTLPEMPDLYVQRFDLMRAQMASPEPLNALTERVGRTLQEGHRVYVVGGLDLSELRPVPSLPRFPEGPQNLNPYMKVWQRQLAYFIQQRARRVGELTMPGAEPSSEYETARVLVIE